MAEVPSVTRCYTVVIGEKLPAFRRVSVLPSAGLYEGQHAVRSPYTWIFRWPCNVYFWLDCGVDLCSCFKVRAWGRKHDSHFLWGGAEKARRNMQVCRCVGGDWRPITCETHRHCYFLWSRADAYNHARAPRTHTNANTLDVRGGTVGRDTALKAGGRGSLRFLIDLNLRPHRGLGVDSASNRNEYHGSLLGLTIMLSVEKFSKPLAPRTKPRGASPGL